MSHRIESVLGATTGWLRAHAGLCLWMLTGVAVALRWMLVTHAPAPFGYIYDPYHVTVLHLDELGRLPDPRVDPESWQPPLFYYVGWLFYRIGLVVSKDAGIGSIAFVSTICGAVNLVYCHRLLKFCGFQRDEQVVGMAVAMTLPVAFIGSFAAEADYLVSTLMIGVSYHLTIYASELDSKRSWQPLALGILTGLALATKYSGLIALGLCGFVVGVKVLRGPDRWRALRNGVLILITAVTIGGWRYADNYRLFHTPLHASGSALAGFAIKKPHYYWEAYDFRSLSLRPLLQLYPPDAPKGQLTTFPVYSSVWTSLHAQMWSDMSFFTEPSRHGFLEIYHARGIPRSLIASILMLAFLPSALAAVGFCASARRVRFWPLAAFAGVSIVAYFNWVLGQTTWAIKAKYVLFLLPHYVVFMLLGLRWLNRWAPPVLSATALAALGVLVLLLHGYLFQFARGV